MKINIFWGDLSSISAKTATLVRKDLLYAIELPYYRITSKYSNALRTSQTCSFAV